jgi:RNA polymerase sigma factor (sigma-70 family)
MRMHERTPTDVGGLIEAALQGNQRAYRELYRRFYWLVAAEIRAVVARRDVTKEIIQETFTCAFLRLGELRLRTRFVPWLRSIARCRAYDWLRAKYHEKLRFMSVLPVIVDPHPDPRVELELAEEEQLLQAGLEMMPEKDRWLLHAFHEQCRSLKEIAAELRKPLGTVKRRLHEARGRLRGLIESGVRLPRKAA